MDELIDKMNHFPLMVFFAVILGAGVIHILSGVAGIVRQGSASILYWPHSLWVTMIFIIHIQYWYSFTQEQYHWSFAYYIFSILGPVLLYTLASVLVPKKIKKAEINLRDWYFEHSPLFFTLVTVTAIYFIAAVFIDPIFIISETTEYKPKYERLVFRIILLILSVLLIKSKNPPRHERVSVVCGVLLLLYLIRIFKAI